MAIGMFAAPSAMAMSTFDRLAGQHGFAMAYPDA
jgi:poly(3-hydroxybutyrate) depolymerase